MGLLTHTSLEGHTTPTQWSVHERETILVKVYQGRRKVEKTNTAKHWLIEEI